MIGLILISIGVLLALINITNEFFNKTGKMKKIMMSISVILIMLGGYSSYIKHANDQEDKESLTNNLSIIQAKNDSLIKATNNLVETNAFLSRAVSAPDYYFAIIEGIININNSRPTELGQLFDSKIQYAHYITLLLQWQGKNFIFDPFPPHDELINKVKAMNWQNYSYDFYKTDLKKLPFLHLNLQFTIENKYGKFFSDNDKMRNNEVVIKPSTFFQVFDVYKKETGTEFSEEESKIFDFKLKINNITLKNEKGEKYTAFESGEKVDIIAEVTDFATRSNQAWYFINEIFLKSIKLYNHDIPLEKPYSPRSVSEQPLGNKILNILIKEKR